jgi:hypothetical protein
VRGPSAATTPRAAVIRQRWYARSSSCSAFGAGPASAPPGAASFSGGVYSEVSSIRTIEALADDRLRYRKLR